MGALHSCLTVHLITSSIRLFFNYGYPNSNFTLRNVQIGANGFHQIGNQNRRNLEEMKRQINQQNRQQYSRAFAQSQFGFSLLEIVVTVLIVGIGILGVISMQANALRESQTNTFRNQASILAQDIIGRMRANEEAVGDTTASVYVSDGSAIASAPACGTAAAICSPAQLATFDINRWQQNIIAANLPSGLGVITRNGTTTTYVISILWDEERDGTSGRGCNPADNADMACFRVTAVF